jgi:hypothetical protein
MMSPLEMLNKKHQLVEKFDSDRPYVLEVAQCHADELIDVQYFSKGEEVTLGTTVGLRLRFAGQPVAWVPQSFSFLSLLMYPFTQTQQEWKSSFFSLQEGELVSWKESQAVIQVSAGWEISIQNAEGEPTALDTPCDGYLMLSIEAGTQVLIKNGHEWFSMRYVYPEKKTSVSFFRQIDGGAYGIAAGVLMSMLTLLMGFMTYQPPHDLSVEESFPLHLFEASINIEKKTFPEEEIIVEKNPKLKWSTVNNKKIPIDSIGSGSAGNLKKLQSKKDVVDSFMGGLNFGGDNATLSDASVLGSNSLIGSIGGSPSHMGGGNGLSLIGGEIGGGGSPSGLGGLLAGNGNRPSRRSIGISLGTFRKHTSIVRSSGNPTVLGGLDRSLIDVVIKKNMAQIRYCYQRELYKHPNLSGKVKVKFVIGNDGSVSRAKIDKSTLKSKKVEDCIANRFMRFRFPKPNGIVIVKYPFSFQSK